MIDRFEIISSGSSRPNAERIIFCDGTGGSLYRADTDLELSHWRPNRTPAEFRAGTSTEICFRFLERPRPGSWTVAVNNHVDVDGILSVYVLVQSDHARAHRQTIVEAAEMGDFWGWGESPAQRVFQGITHLMEQGGAGKAIYEEAFRRIPALIDGSDPLVPEIEASLAPLRQGVELVEAGRIIRNQIDPRLAHYNIPLAVAGDDDARASYAPEFNEAISPKAILWPHVRARWDAQRVCLVSTERQAGWFHDLCLPGYLLADTAGRWLVPGLTYHDSMSSYEIRHDGLVAAMQELQRQEAAGLRCVTDHGGLTLRVGLLDSESQATTGQWGLGGTALPFGEDLQKRFPVVGRFLDELGQPAVSHLAPDEVAKAFEGIF